jgi:hypothetical protein
LLAATGVSFEQPAALRITANISTNAGRAARPALNCEANSALLWRETMRFISSRRKSGAISLGETVPSGTPLHLIFIG